MIRPHHTTPQEWEAADRMITVVLMRQSGHRFSAIAKSMGVSHAGVRSLYQRAQKSRVAKWLWLERMKAFNESLRRREQSR